MSGILAVLSLNGRPVDERLACEQLAAIAHRGDRVPRLWQGDGIALGHVNLPTTPEAEREMLPACDPSGRYWITWDGRLDNRAELARLLQLVPAAAREMTDADYVQAAYACWGESCVHHLLGDWAFIIWDSHARRLFCAKDPLGWRQLVFAEQAGMLFIGSEPQQLFAGGLVPRAINHEYLLRFLGGAMQNPGETCYAGILRLAGGQTLVASGTSTRVSTYWQQPRTTAHPYKRPEQYVDEFVAVFRAATRARLRSNRRVGAYLSGGLDSSYVAAIAVEQGAELTAITSYVPHSDWWDERPYARAVVEHLGIDWSAVDISDCWTLSRKWLSDEVFDDPEIPVQSASLTGISAAARAAGCGVMLGGEGGDEWLAGGWMGGSAVCIADALLSAKLGTAWRLAERMRSRRSAPVNLARVALASIAPRPVQEVIARLRGHHPVGEGASVVQSEPDWISLTEYVRTPVWPRRRFQAAMWQLYRSAADPVVAWRDRHEQAANTLEHRTPFNDLRVVELLASTPEWMKQFNGRPKDLLREAEYRVLPAAIPDRLDKAVMDELHHTGAGYHEQERVARAVDAVATLPGVQAGIARAEVERWMATRDVWWHTPWRVIAAGLWLCTMGVSHPTLGMNRATISGGKEVAL